MKRRDALVALAALPTWEHYAPLLVAVGAGAGSSPGAAPAALDADTAGGADDSGPYGHPDVRFPITGFWMEGAFTKRSVQLG